MVAITRVVAIETTLSTAAMTMVNATVRVAGRVQYALIHVQMVLTDYIVNIIVHAKMAGNAIDLQVAAGMSK